MGEGIGAFDGFAQFGRQFALFFDALQDGGAAFFEFFDFFEQGLNIGDLHFIERSGGFLAVTGDKGYGSARFEEFEHGFHAAQGDIERGGNTIGVGHCCVGCALSGGQICGVLGRKCGKVTNGSQDSFIDNKLSAHFSDVCYVGQTNAQKPLRIAIEFEHKSAKPDSPLAEQLLRYISNIWNADVRQQRDLSLTIPIVLYHGHEVIQKEALSGLFPGASKGLLSFVPSFDYILLDIQRIPDAQLEMLEFLYLRNILLALKYSRNENYIDQFWQKIVIFAPVNTQMSVRDLLLQATIYYLTFSSITFQQKLNTMSTSAEMTQHPEVKTILEELYEQGMAKGMETGIEKGIEKGVKKGIEKGMEKMLLAFMRHHPGLDDKAVAEVMEVDAAFVALVRKKL